MKEQINMNKFLALDNHFEFSRHALDNNKYFRKLASQ